MNTITSKIELEEHCGNQQPKDPWKFGKAVENAQDWNNLPKRHSVLFNKGRYFEATILDKKLLVSISKAIKVKIEYGSYIVSSWKKLEAFVKAMNKRGYYVSITIDWI